MPEAEESTSYGTPAFKVGGKLFARLHQDGESLVVRIDKHERVMRMQADPATYFITEHYVNYPWILVRLASVSRDDLGELLKDAWQLVAPSRSAARKR
ncbi:MAG: MmcQ/YjbR family DNA-binding protein [Planctomycetaceae bacterium]|nr:MmcQ/YjbR family DNA-binding protein [Planctomycetaceae bacterium]